MRARTFSLVAVMALLPLAVRAQHPGGGDTVGETRAPREATQYDFLVGQWELTVTPKVSGLVGLIHGAPKLRGSWKGTRALDGWGVEDELRIADESGNPVAYTHFVRMYDAKAKRWVVSAMDVFRKRATISAAEWQGGEMVSTTDGLDPDGKAYRTRTRITDISPAAFRLQQDVSYDKGATWDEAHLVIDAKRTSGSASQ
ncbi:MAG TPA: hypothetical protein VK617_04765 [Gemmatimonadaceae bacterium]|nr:hypothetical protein [Gemmatimonadaceae bacterium]